MGAISEAGTTVEWPVELPAVRRRDAWIARASGVELRLTNLSKVFWSEAGYTKGDLVAYYFNVAPTLLPHVAQRPLTLKRMPDGVGGVYFYEKDAPPFTPPWMPTLRVRAGTADRTIRFVTVRDAASLLWLANAGCIELHAHHTRGAVQEHPTYAVFDLDRTGRRRSTTSGGSPPSSRSRSTGSGCGRIRRRPARRECRCSCRSTRAVPIARCARSSRRCAA